MTSHVGRLYALAFALVVFFLAWAIVAAHPWATASADPRLRVLAAREARLRHEARLVDQVVKRRWAAYRRALRARNAEIAAVKAHAARQAASAATAASSVRVVMLPPLTITRTS
jgi:type IV secretory pathway TraG/TraD family ATPase VirD4